jgi:CubicO group peptidase (beta-lactamase class C family)
MTRMPNQCPSDSVDVLLLGRMKALGIPGLQVAVVRYGSIVKCAAYGVADLAHSIAVTEQTLFPINSCTKAFTGVAIMQLVEAGKLELDAPVGRYLDGLPGAWQAATVRQLLTHTSGIPNIMNEDAKLLSDGGDDAAWAAVLAVPMESSPGERFSYNQTGYLLLGRIIDRLSGQPFTRFIAERQVEVAGMPRTAQAGFVDSRDIVPGAARVYSYSRFIDGRSVRTQTLGHVYEEFPLFLRTAAGISSTAEEMARWIIALQQGRFLGARQSLATLWTPGVLNDGSQQGFSELLNGYALGWPTMSRAQLRAVGGIGGGRAAFFVYPDDDLAIVILTNLQGASPETFIDDVARCYVPAAA